jgi:hypothetical protein
MTARILIAIVLFAALAAIAFWLERRKRTDAPPMPVGRPPEQLDRADFVRPDAPWLVVLFTSAACTSCAGLYEKAKPLESDDVAVTEVEYAAQKNLHERYHVDAAPMTVVADRGGVVRKSFVGAFGATELWTAVAELRAS